MKKKPVCDTNVLLAVYIFQVDGAVYSKHFEPMWCASEKLTVRRNRLSIKRSASNRMGVQCRTGSCTALCSHIIMHAYLKFHATVCLQNKTLHKLQKLYLNTSNLDEIRYLKRKCLIHKASKFTSCCLWTWINRVSVLHVNRNRNRNRIYLGLRRGSFKAWNNKDSSTKRERICL